MRVGAIDIGTNSIHLLVAEVIEGRIEVVERAREQVELGAGGIGSNRIHPEALSRGVQALARFREACDSLGAQDIHAAATSAVREAENGRAFCAAVKQRTGIHVRVISGVDEARLIYLGVRSDLDYSRGRVLVFDVGGGSTEFILCDAEQPLLIDSLPLGHIRLTEADGDPWSRDDRYRALKHRVRDGLRPLLARLDPDDAGSLVGTSGTVRALARIATLQRGDPLPPHGSGLVLFRHELDALVSLLKDEPSALEALPGMDDRRRRTLPAGAILVREVMRALKAERLTTSDRSLRDGLVVDWILRNRPEVDLARVVPDPRRRAVLALMDRYRADEAHARLVARNALELFDRLAPLHRLRADDRRLLEFAALLHDVGHHVAGKDHHKHGQYLIQHSRMSGFTAPEIHMLGALVRYHRGGGPKTRHPEYAALGPADRRKVRVLSGILRLADALDRGGVQNVVHLEVALGDDAVVVSAWTRDAGDLERWAAVQRVRLLEQAIGRPVQVRVERRPEG